MSAPLLVADSGPLIALARVALLDLPSRLFGQVLVPVDVWEEVMRRPSEVERVGLLAAMEHRQLTLATEVEQPSPALTDPRLGAGERAAIATAQAWTATVLIDERRGRRAALDAGLHVVGTLGLLVRGRELGLIPPVRPTIDALRGSGYHLSESLAAQVLALLGE